CRDPASLGLALRPPEPERRGWPAPHSLPGTVSSAKHVPLLLSSPTRPDRLPNTNASRRSICISRSERRPGGRGAGRQSAGGPPTPDATAGSSPAVRFPHAGSSSEERKPAGEDGWQERWCVVHDAQRLQTTCNESMQRSRLTPAETAAIKVRLIA